MIFCIMYFKKGTKGVELFAAVIFLVKLSLYLIVQRYFIEQNKDGIAKISFYYETGFFQVMYLIYTFFCTVDWIYG